MVRPLDDSQGSSPLQGHGIWLTCEVALRSKSIVVGGWVGGNGEPLFLWVPWELNRIGALRVIYRYGVTSSL